VLNNLSLIYLDQEKIDLAVNALSEALQIAKQTNQLSSQAGFLNNLAQAIGLRGDFINAQTYFQQSLEIIRKIGARRDEGLVLGNLGWIAASLGDYKRAHAYHTENLKLNRQMSHPLLEGYAMINLSAAACALGNFAEAVQWGEQAVVLTRQINNTNGEAWALTYLGHARLAQDHLLEAAEAYDAAIKLRNQLQQNILAAEPLAGLARVLFVQGNISAAGRQLKPILSLLDSGSMFEGTDEPVRIYHTCYIVLDALNDERANSILAKGYETLQARAAQIPDETIRRQFLEDIPHHRQLRDAWENKNRPI
jgi:tetratricopeptide (TPR) repeat protein